MPHVWVIMWCFYNLLPWLSLNLSLMPCSLNVLICPVVSWLYFLQTHSLEGVNLMTTVHLFHQFVITPWWCYVLWPNPHFLKVSTTKIQLLECWIRTTRLRMIICINLSSISVQQCGCMCLKNNGHCDGQKD